MKILVIPDIHLKPWMFDRASEILDSGAAERAVCLMDIPDDWDQETNLDLYNETFDKAINFQKKYTDTLWCLGNHDLSYLWFEHESGFSLFALSAVNDKMAELRRAMPDESQMAYVHRIDDVLFAHGGLTRSFVEHHAPDADYDDADDVISKINSLGRDEMWNHASPIWYRPHFRLDEMYREDEFLQIVGHTPVKNIERRGNVITCDLFSTYRGGEPIGTEEFLIVDTENREYKGIRVIIGEAPAGEKTA